MTGRGFRGRSPEKLGGGFGHSDKVTKGKQRFKDFRESEAKGAKPKREARRGHPEHETPSRSHQNERGSHQRHAEPHQLQ